MAASPGPRYPVVSVANVHNGWPGPEAGTIKYLRISRRLRGRACPMKASPAVSTTFIGCPRLGIPC